MRKNYDFSNATKNPHAGKLKDGFTVVVEHKDFDEIITVKKSAKLKPDNSKNADIGSSITATNI